MLAVFYRVFVNDAPREVGDPIYENDRYIGRILATSIAPPHTAESLKRSISIAEGIINYSRCDIFLDWTGGEPVSDGPISIMVDDCPGSTPVRSMLVVFSLSTPETAPLLLAPADVPVPVPQEPSKFTTKRRAIQDCRQLQQALPDPQINDLPSV